jgi:pimeloyl-ACP methyl ester carboxylesterase
MHFIDETTSNGVIERSFQLGDVTGVLWSPQTDADNRPLVLMGHGGGLHKRFPGLVARGLHYVTECDFHVAAIDAPGHGDRPRNAEDKNWVAELRGAREAGKPIDTVVATYNASLAERAVPEWRATLDALQAIPGFGTGPVGYTGMTLATTIGIPLAAAEPRITAAIFGGAMAFDALLESARRVTIPIQFLLPWDDAEISREAGLQLYDAFASAEKTLHANPGDHRHVPWFETEDSLRFLRRHLRPAVAAE